MKPLHFPSKHVLVLVMLCVPFVAMAQFGKLLKKADSSLNGMKAGSSLSPSTVEIQKALKETLEKGLLQGVKLVGAKDGFLNNPAIKLLFPPEAKQVESTLRDLGMSSTCDRVIVSMNRAAEDAAKKAVPIFLQSLRSMSFADARQLLAGGDNAATTYFQGSTGEQLTKAFRPSIDSSLQKVGATVYWHQATQAYNKVPFVQAINPDLGEYVTAQAVTGLFTMIAREELNMRKKLALRSSPLLKKVFGFADAQKK